MFELTDVQTDLVEEPEEAGFRGGGECGACAACAACAAGGWGGGRVGGGVGRGCRGGIRNRRIEFGEIIFR